MQAPREPIKEFDYKVIEKDGKRGIIDANGHIVVEPVFNNVGLCSIDDCDYALFRLDGYGEAAYPLSKIKEL